LAHSNSWAKIVFKYPTQVPCVTKESYKIEQSCGLVFGAAVF